MAKKMKVESADLEKLLGRVNRVTCYFRHNNDNVCAIPRDAMIELTNYQIEFEQKYMRK